MVVVPAVAAAVVLAAAAAAVGTKNTVATVQPAPRLPPPRPAPPLVGLVVSVVVVGVEVVGLVVAGGGVEVVVLVEVVGEVGALAGRLWGEWDPGLERGRGRGMGCPEGMARSVSTCLRTLQEPR